MKTRRIGIVGYDGLQALDVAGPADVFTTANSRLERKTAPYEVVLLAARKGPIATESGVSLYSDGPLRGLLDTIIVPEGARFARSRKCARTWRPGCASTRTGLAASRQSARESTRWRNRAYWTDGPPQRIGASQATSKERWKKIRVNADAIFVKDGKYYTSAGVTAGVDLCLALIEEDFGNELALEVARELVVYLKRSGGQLQYSQPLLLQTRAKKHFGDIASWIRGHLDEELTAETLAERANLSARHFNRKFKGVFGLTPADFVEELRLDEARWLLANADASIESVAGDVGYRSDDTFRRAFERRFGVGPSEYRRRFGAAGAS